MKTTDPRTALSADDARLFLGLPEDASLPPQEQLTADAGRIVRLNFQMFGESMHLAEQGLLVSPIWERKGPAMVARLAVLPPVFHQRYYEGQASETLDDPAMLTMVAQLMPWMLDDPVGAAFALDGTHRVWFDREGPNRDLDVPFGDHLRVLSLILADLARKAGAGFTTLEWLVSLGLPIEDFHEPEDPPEAEVLASMERLRLAMVTEERAWKQKAFTR